MTSRAFAAIVSIGLCGAALEPLVRAPDDDGFPLSTYPMFAAPRSMALTAVRAEAATREGRLRPLTPTQLGTGEVMQAFSTLQRVAEAGPAACAALCAAIAARVAGSPDRDIVEVRLVIGTYDALEIVAHGAARIRAADEVVLARCDVGERAKEAQR